MIEDVPSEVCMQCGEKYFAPEATIRTGQILKRESFPGEKTMLVPVRSYAVTEDSPV